MTCKNIILLTVPYKSSLLAKNDRSVGYALVVRAQWIAMRCNARRTYRVSGIHSSPRATYRLRRASTGDLDREHGRGSSACNGVHGTAGSLRPGDEQ